MSKEELLNEYKKDVENIKKRAKQMKLSDSEINKVFKDCFETINQKNVRSNLYNLLGIKAQRYIYISIKLFTLFTLITLFIYILLNVHQPTSSIVLRNVQGLIYPGLKVLRFLSVPVIKKYPTLTGLYDESCLLENPYFYVSDMECWPCENVYSVIDLTGFNNHSLYQSGAPYIAKTEQSEVTFNQLQESYMTNKDLLDDEANNLKSTDSTISNLQDLFTKPLSSNAHIVWRINKMRSSRVIRKLFPRPYIISEWSGQSVERYLIIDQANAEAYTLPNTECSYIFMIQGSGERTIILKPSKECSDSCRTVSVILKPSYVLWYNWWYWRPISLPTKNATQTSISYINSYC